MTQLFNSDRMVCAEITVHANGAREGLVFFRVVNPINKTHIHTSFIMEVQNFCETQNLFFDRDLVDQLLAKLTYQHGNGWLVPKEHIDSHTPISSANKYLRSVETDLF